MNVATGLSEIFKVVVRECRLIMADSRLRSVVLIAPFLYASLFGFVYYRHTVTKIPLAVVQKDFSGPARTLLRMVAASPRLAIVAHPQSITALEDLFLSGGVDAGIVIDDDFGTRLKRGKAATLPCYVNASSMVAANTAAKALNEIIQTFSAGVEIKTMMKKGERLDDAKERFMPVRMDLRSLFNPSYNYSNFMVPGLLAAILQQVILLGVALSWTGERENNTLGQLFSLSRSPLRLLIGKSLPYLIVNMIVAEFYLRVLFPLNDIPMQGDWRLAIPFTFLFVMTIVTWGMWVSALTKTRLFATQILMFLAMPSFVLSGFTWPRYAMPEWVQWLGQCLPLTYFVNSFRNIYLAGAPLIYAKGDILALGGFLLTNLVVCYLVVLRLVRQVPAQPEAR